MKLELLTNFYPGFLIIFTGIDGSGKTTLLKETEKYLSEKGYSFFSTKMPSDSMRKNPLFKNFYSKDKDIRGQVDFLAISLMVMADRLQHLKTEILPNLEKGNFVLCDRYVDTGIVEALSRSYHNDGKILSLIVKRFPKPDVSFLTHISPDIAINRIRERSYGKDNYLDEKILQKQSEIYYKIGINNDMRVIKTDKNIENVFEEVHLIIDKLLFNKKEKNRR